MTKINWLSFLLLGFLAGCSSKLANYDYTTSAEFHQLKTYEVVQGEQGGYQTLDGARIEQAVAQSFQGRYSPAAAEQGDFTVTYWFEEERKIDQSGVSFGFGVSRGNVGVGVSTGPQARERVDGRLVLSISSKASGQVIWQAKATKGVRDSMNPQRREELIQATVAEMLANFPP